MSYSWIASVAQVSARCLWQLLCRPVYSSERFSQVYMPLLLIHSIHCKSIVKSSCISAVPTLSWRQRLWHSLRDPSSGLTTFRMAFRTVRAPSVQSDITLWLMLVEGGLGLCGDSMRHLQLVKQVYAHPESRLFRRQPLSIEL